MGFPYRHPKDRGENRMAKDKSLGVGVGDVLGKVFRYCTHGAPQHSLLVPPEWSSSHVNKVSQLIHSAVRFESYFQMRVQLADRWDMQEESLVLGGLVSLKESHWAQVSHWRASQETNVRSTIKQELWASCSAGAFCLRTDLLSDICHITFA